MLSHLHPHQRDVRISFHEPTHTYTLYDPEGKTYSWKPKSVTTLIHGFFAPFEPDVIIGRMMASRNWPNSIYFGDTPEQIKAKWLEGNKLGTLLHNTIEDFYNGKIISSSQIDPKIQKEFIFFLQFYFDFSEKNPDWQPFRTEQFVFDVDYRISGAIDMTFINSKGELWIIDWKRSRQIRKGNGFQSGKPPLSHLEDCNFNTYSLQLNLYRRLLERNYGHRVVKMDLLVCHPDNDNYMPYSIDFMDAEIDAILEVRAAQVEAEKEKEEQKVEEGISLEKGSVEKISTELSKLKL